MINLKKIINKFWFIPYVFPITAYADDTTLNFSSKTDDFKNLENITPTSFIATAISLALSVTIIVFFFIFLIGGYRWITSSGDEKKLGLAKNQITHGFIGLVIILSSWVILNLIGTLFDIDILNFTIPSFITK